jgi:hypothetical protein
MSNEQLAIMILLSIIGLGLFIIGLLMKIDSKNVPNDIVTYGIGAGKTYFRRDKYLERANEYFTVGSILILTVLITLLL